MASFDTAIGSATLHAEEVWDPHAPPNTYGLDFYFVGTGSFGTYDKNGTDYQYPTRTFLLSAETVDGSVTPIALSNVASFFYSENTNSLLLFTANAAPIRQYESDSSGNITITYYRYYYTLYDYSLDTRTLVELGPVWDLGVTFTQEGNEVPIQSSIFDGVTGTLYTSAIAEIRKVPPFGPDEIIFRSDDFTRVSYSLTGDDQQLFTTSADNVNFNQLTPSQAAAVTSGADLYHSLGGADEVWLPASGQALVPGINWDSSKVFSIGADASVVPPGNDGATVHVGPSDDLIDGAYETNIEFGGAAGQRGNVVFTNGDTVEFSGSLNAYTIKELTGGYLEVRDNRGMDGTDILKDIAFLKFEGGDGRTAGPTTISASGRQVQTVTDAWLQSHISSSVSPEVKALVLSLIDKGGNAQWAADPTAPGHYTITWSILADPSKLPADYLANSGFGVTSVTQATGAQYTAFHQAITNIFNEIHTFLPNVTFQEVNENAAADPQASALGFGDVGTIRFLGFGDISKDNANGYGFTPGSSVNARSILGDILLNQKYLNSPDTFVSNNTSNGYVVLEHEIGHALGLGDVTSPYLPTIMDYIPLDAFHPVVDYTAADILALQALYGSNASTNSAKLQDGYISGATVFSDENGNGQLDLTEASTITDSTGGFAIPNGTGPLVGFGGTDTSTGLTFKGQLSAPSGSSVITPLTTLMALLSSDPQAEQKVLSSFGLSSSIDLNTFDPIAAAQAGSADGAATTAAVAKVYDAVSLIASTLVAAGSDFSSGVKEAFAAIAAAIGGSGISLTNEAQVSALIVAAAQADGLTLGQGVADSVAAIIVETNTLLDQKAQSGATGDELLNAIAAIERVVQGTASNAIQQAGNDPDQLEALVDAFSGESLDDAVLAALEHLGVNDTTAPTLTPIADQRNEATTAAGATAFFAATALDNVDGTVPIVFKEGNTVVHSGDVFGLGSHTITASTIDAVGNVSSDTFEINVVDTTAPTLAPIADQVFEATSASGAAAFFAATAADLVDGTAPVVFREGNTVVLSGDTFSFGTHTITATAVDAAGNQTLQNFKFNVVDTTAPTLTPVANQTREAISAAGAAAFFTATATDLVDGVASVVFREGNRVVNSGDIFGLGNHTITASTIDVAGNIASETFTINVQDTTAPTLTPIADQTLQAPNAAGAAAFFTTTASDLVDGTNPVVFKEGDRIVHSGDIFQVGVHTITASVVDAAGNSATDIFEINVVGATCHNHDPIAIADSNGVAKGKSLSVSANKGVLSNDRDADHDHLSVGSVNGSAANVGHSIKGEYGALTLNADGSYSYAATTKALPGKIFAQDTFTYTNVDGHGGSDAATLTFSVYDPSFSYKAGSNTILWGDNGKNVLDGSAGHDLVYGGNGADVLIGGNGDILAGGKGPDQFVFRADFGVNTILDFDVKNDYLQFDDSVFNSVKSILDHTTNTPLGALISDGHGDSVLLLGVNKSLLMAHSNDLLIG